MLYASDPASLMIKKVGSESGLFDSRSGRSHLISAESLALLEAISTPATLQSHAAHVIETFDIESEGDPRDAVMARLDELVRLGLLHGVHP